MGLLICTYPAMTEKCGASGSSRCWNQALQFCETHHRRTLRYDAHSPLAHSPTRMKFGDIVT